MRQFANQLWQVAVVYVTQVRALVWALVAVLVAFFLWGLGSSDEPASVVSSAYFPALILGQWIIDQVKHQFAHPRGRMMPKFNAAHVAVPIGLIFVVGVALPIAIGAIRHIDPLPYAMASSMVMAILLLLRLHPRLSWLAFAIFMLAICYPKYSGHDIDFASILFRPTSSIPLFLLGWLGIGFYFYRICHLSEDDEVYQRLSDEIVNTVGDGNDGGTRKKFKDSGYWWAIADRWHARIGGFHEFRRIRIIRLLCYGFGATPVELAAFGLAVGLTVALLVMAPKPNDSYRIARSGAYTFLMLPALFASMGPIAVAGSAIGWRVPRLKNEILFPLPRRELIDDLLLASAWHSFVIWILGCASGLAVLLYWLPGKVEAIPLVATAALLTASTAIAAYGLSLHLVMFEVKLSQLFVLGLFAVGFITMMLTWWATRDETGEALFWILALIETGVGIQMIRTGRTAWHNQEFG